MLKVNYSTRDPSDLQNIYDIRSKNDCLNLRTTTTSVPTSNLTSSTNKQDVQLQPFPKPSVNKVANSSGKIVPVFKSKVASGSSITPQHRSSEKKLVPVFRNMKTTQPQSGPTPLEASSIGDQYTRLELLHDNINMYDRGTPTRPTSGLFDRELGRPIPLAISRPNANAPGLNPFLIQDKLEEDFQLSCPATSTNQGAFVGESSLYSVKRKASVSG